MLKMTQQFMYDTVADATKHTSVKHTRLKHHGEQQWLIKKLNKFPISHLKYYRQTPTVMLKKVPSSSCLEEINLKRCNPNNESHHLH